MKIYILRAFLIIGICFAFSFFLAACDFFPVYKGGNSNGNNQQDKDNSDNNQQSTDNTEEEEDDTDIPLSPGGPLPGADLRENLSVVSQRADQHVIYDIVIHANAVYEPLIVRTGGKNVTVKIYSEPPNQYTLALGSPGSLFTVGDSTTLILENIIIQGQPGNNRALLKVEGGGTLIIEDGAVITGNENSAVVYNEYSSEGGGVNVGENATFIMNGGQICYNKRIHHQNHIGHGAGVLIDRDGYFNMTGGIIHNNEANSYGGGVAIFYGRFLMNGGEIAGNDAYYGGGVYAWSANVAGRLTYTFVKEPLPGKLTSGIIWGYPANDGKENYANGPAVWYDWAEAYYSVYRESTLGEYHAISSAYLWYENTFTIIEDSGWEYRR